jgi:hypothetical protein
MTLPPGAAGTFTAGRVPREHLPSLARGSGTRFWWSKEGASQYNRLWVSTYNFLCNAGVHDLVYLHPAQLQSSATRWVLFTTWHTTYISDTSLNPAATINAVYNSAYVVTRDEESNLR